MIIFHCYGLNANGAIEHAFATTKEQIDELAAEIVANTENEPEVREINFEPTADTIVDILNDYFARYHREALENS